MAGEGSGHTRGDGRRRAASRRRAFVVPLVVLLAASVLSGCILLRPGSVAGTIRDPAGNPLAGIVVTVATPVSATAIATAVTDEDGTYSVADLPGGTYRVGAADPAAVHRETWAPHAPDRLNGVDVGINGAAVTANITMGCAGTPPVVGCARAPSTITVTATPAGVGPGENQTISVAVPTAPGGPVPTGTLTAVDFATPPGVLIDGRLVVDIALPYHGSWTYPVTYSGDAFYAPSTAPVGFTVEPGMGPFAGAGAKVAVMGDSITYWSRPPITAQLGTAGYNRSVTGLAGASTLSVQWLVDAYAAEQPEVFVLNLGANDIRMIANGVPGHSVAQFQASVLSIAAQFPEACVVATTLSEQRTSATIPNYARHNEIAAEMNSWLRATFPHVLDWEQVTRGATAAGATLLSDEVHPTFEGTDVLAQHVLAQVDACTGRLASP